MSYLSVPQINFQGVAYCNPSTANNNDFANIFDIDTLKFTPEMTVINQSGNPAVVLDPPGEQVFSYQNAQSAPQCRAWLMGLMENVSDGGPYGQQAHWNYYGDHGTRIDNSKVNSLIGSNGSPFPATDPLFGATISLIGTPSPMQFQDPVIVDNDPYALITSQIFSHGLQVTAADGTSLISASPASRAFAYYINGSKNLDPTAIGFQMVSAVFLLSVPNGSGLVINANAGSPALNDFAKAVANGAGIQLRFIFYNAIYQIPPNQLWDNFRRKNYTPNPYIGKALGTIGVLSTNDMFSAPPGRKLNVQKNSFTYLKTAPCQPGSAPAAQSATLGITLANIDAVNEVVYLDCVSTFPECNVETNTKFNFGPKPLDLQLTPDGGGTPVTIGPIPNTQATYEQNAGMIAIPFSSHPQAAEIKGAATSGTLSIFDENAGQVLLTESPGIDIQTDDRAVYFDVQTVENWDDPNEQAVPGVATVTIRAFRRGIPIQDSVKVNLEYWMCQKDLVDPSKPQVPVPSRYFTVSGAVAQPNTKYTDAPGNKGTISVITDQVTIPANSNGESTLTLTGVRPGTSVIRFVDPTVPAVPPNFCWDNTDYCCVRILPFDDYRAYTNAQVNEWPFIYENFFNYFALLYPVMSEVIPWGPTDAPDNPNIVQQFAAQLRIFTNPANWNSTIYMPITRDLSAGKRALLLRWCALQGA